VKPFLSNLDRTSPATLDSRASGLRNANVLVLDWLLSVLSLSSRSKQSTLAYENLS
jgi:hypothetical protein